MEPLGTVFMPVSPVSVGILSTMRTFVAGLVPPLTMTTWYLILP
jgi:hypothetical protein